MAERRKRRREIAKLLEAPVAKHPTGTIYVAWERFLHFGKLTSDVHHRSVTGPHWHLPVIGVAPEAQRRGLGSALLTTMCDRLDHEALPAYLDTGTAENVAFYQRHGFMVVTELLEPTSGVLIRGMRRDPR